MTLHGLPPAITSAGISFVTILPAAIILLAPIVTPLRTWHLAPNHTSSQIVIAAEGINFSFENYCLRDYLKTASLLVIRELWQKKE